MNQQTDQKSPPCPCGARMVLRHSAKFNRDFFSCEKYPDCKNTHSSDNEGRPVGIPADAETRKLRTELKIELDKYFSIGQWYEKANEIAKFLKSNTGETKVGVLNKEQIEILLTKLRKT